MVLFIKLFLLLLHDQLSPSFSTLLQKVVLLSPPSDITTMSSRKNRGTSSKLDSRCGYLRLLLIEEAPNQQLVQLYACRSVCREALTLGISLEGSIALLLSVKIVFCRTLPKDWPQRAGSPTTPHTTQSASFHNPFAERTS